tara:strand:- start:415 stop:654 length:240 start_codon:yes stop_codon:yes gene_type:complete
MKIDMYFANLIWKDTLEEKTVNVAVVPEDYDFETDPLGIDEQLFFAFNKGENMLGDHGEFLISSVVHSDVFSDAMESNQ